MANPIRDASRSNGARVCAVVAIGKNRELGLFGDGGRVAFQLAVEGIEVGERLPSRGRVERDEVDEDAGALDVAQELVAQAGTGVGKSFAYLVRRRCSHCNGA